MVSVDKLCEGREFTIYAIVENNHCFIREFIEKLQVIDQKRIMALLKRCADFGLPKNTEKFRHLIGKIYELKSHQIRMLCTFDEGRIIILTNGFIKKQQKTPKKEIDKAERLIRAYFDMKKEEDI